MRAVSRFGQGVLAAVLGLAPAVVLAQETPPTTNTPASDSVGPQELHDFSLKGSPTAPAAQTPPVQAPAPAPAQTPPAQPTRQPTATTTPPATAPSVTQSTVSQTPVHAAAPKAAPSAPSASAGPKPTVVPEALSQTPPSSSVTVALPKLQNGVGSANSVGASASSASSGFAPAPDVPGTLAAGHGFPLLPWLFAALLLAAGGMFLFWRNRGRPAFAGGPQIDAFSGPVPTPPAAPPRAPESPAPAPREAPPIAPLGIVSTRIRAWMDIGFLPRQCVIDDQNVTIEFDLELYNSGSAPARAILAEAAIFNAGPRQDQEIEAFFANPVGQGERIAVIPPLQRVAVRTKVMTTRAQMQAYELGGRQVYVPVIAFNVLYSCGSSEGQTSVSYLIGAATSGAKMAPFRLDLAPRIFRGLTGRPLPTGVRR